MREPYVQLMVHLVWSTWERAPWLGPHLLGRVAAQIADHARRLGCQPVHVGGTSDHLHVLVGLPPSLAVATLVQRLKGSSSHAINHHIAPGSEFRWQGGYGVFTVSSSDYVACRDYVNDQERRHATGTVNQDWEAC